MTKLEEEIRGCISHVGQDGATLDEDVTDLVEVVKKHVEKAWKDAFASTTERWNGEEQGWDSIDRGLLEQSLQEWLKENGITE